MRQQMNGSDNGSSASGSLANNGETNTTNFTITNNTVPSTSDESTVQPTQCLVVYKGYVINPTVYDENSIGDNDGANGYLKKFNQFQKVAAAKSSSSDFSVESNIQHIMALNNTLLDILSEQELTNLSSYFKINDELLDATLERQSKTIIVDYMLAKFNSRQSTNLLTEFRDSVTDDISLIDLIRIAHMSKKSVDQNMYEGVLGIHTVGFQATVYITSLVNSGFYVMLEIYSPN
ncbi:hypothetical protein EDC94DRAFT_585897 [Helicostylum pulchrum]|nr:hypothetical protein EDC94DRAFT_585897 [Helicostylum pulchrum]